MLKSAIKERNRLLLATSGQLFSSAGKPGEKSRNLALNAAARKFGSLPARASDYSPFETPDGRVRAERFETDGWDIWSLRFTEPDKGTRGRDWRVEITSAISDTVEHFSCRLSVYSADQNFSFIPSTPGVLKDVVSGMTVFNHGLSFFPEPMEIGVDCSLAKLADELQHEERWWNTIVVSESDNAEWGLDCRAIQKFVMGAANVYYLPSSLEDEFIETFGAAFAIYGGAARTFRPGFDLSSSEPLAHPVLRAPPKDNRWLMARAHHILSSSAFQATLERSDYRTEAPGFFDVRQKAAEKRANAASVKPGSKEENARLREALSAARDEVDIATDLGRQAESEREKARQEAESERVRNHELCARIEFLEHRLRTANQSTEAPEPNSYGELANWVSENLAGRLRLNPRAINSLKKASYKSVSEVVSALKLLATTYRKMKMGEASKAMFDEECQAMGIRMSGSISDSRAGEQGDEYKIIHKGRKTFLEHHLKKGTAHDERHSLRIYFIYDDDDSEVVVGWLPGHLRNRKS